MKGRRNMLTLLAAVALTAQGAKIEQVIVRQQWPWSTDVKVEYRLTGVTAPVDIAVTTYNGDAELPLPASAVVGDLYGIDADGVGQFVIDPVAAFGTAKVALANFKVKLAVSASAANVGEVLYKIFDLTDGSCRDVTRADFLNGKMGAYETDYGRIGEGYSTSLPDVLVWTGVTNNPAYKSTKLVMRKIPAAAAGEWTMGAPAGEKGQYTEDWAVYEEQHQVQLTQDFYIGVFEWTEGQHQAVRGNNQPDNFEHPRYFEAWKDMLTGSFMLLNQKFAGLGMTFGYPTETQWEFACRAGTTSALYSGKEMEGTNTRELGWTTGSPDRTPNSNMPVGLLRPNAYGLYDMYGNVGEWCSDWYYSGSLKTFYDNALAVNPQGPGDGGSYVEGAKKQLRGGTIGQPEIYARSACRNNGVATTAYGIYFYGWRICCMANE